MIQPRLIELPERGDDRGMLVAIEQRDIPFEIQRVYYLYATKPNVRRGLHAHRQLRQLAVAVSGSCKFLLDDGSDKLELVLDRPTLGLVLEPTMWREMFDFSRDCVLMILANLPYTESEYVRDYDEFLRLAAARRSP